MLARHLKNLNDGILFTSLDAINNIITMKCSISIEMERIS
jgi:hypothetical protein